MPMLPGHRSSCIWRGARSDRSRLWFTAWSLSCLLLVIVGDGSRSKAEEDPGWLPRGDEPAAAHQTDPVSAELALQRAVEAFGDGDYRLALELVEGLPRPTAASKYLRGLCLLRLGRPEEADKVLELLGNGETPEAEMVVDAAIARLHAGYPEEAVDSLSSHVTDHPDDSHAHFFLGLSLMELGLVDEAQQQWDLAAADANMVPYRDFFNQRTTPLPPRLFDESLEAQRAARPWNLGVFAGYEFDSNLPLAPFFQGLGSDIEREDSRIALGLYGGFRLRDDDDYNVGVFGSAYTTHQFRIHEFDVQTYSGGAYINRNQDLDGWFLGANYEFSNTLLDEEQFAADHRLTLSGTRTMLDDDVLTTYYRYNVLDIDGPALIAAQHRSANVHAVGATYAMTMDDDARGRLVVGYRFDEADAKGRDFEMSGHLANALLEYRLTADLIGSSEVRYFWDNYDHPNSLDFFERPREDERVELRVGLQKLLSAQLKLRLDYSFIESDSNVANLFGVGFYSYQRHILSTQLIYDF